MPAVFGVGVKPTAEPRVGSQSTACIRPQYWSWPGLAEGATRPAATTALSRGPPEIQAVDRTPPFVRVVLSASERIVAGPDRVAVARDRLEDGAPVVGLNSIV